MTMTKFIALLRGINVSGQKRISMASLIKSCEALGLRGVRTYLQSGNVVFCARQADSGEIAALLSARIAHDFGHEVKALVLSEAELNLVVGANPLWPKLGGDLKLFHGTFISQPISEERFQELELPAQPGEQAVLAGQVIYLYCPHGYGRTKLNNRFFEKTLGVTATTRNWRTIMALRDMCAEQSSECR